MNDVRCGHCNSNQLVVVSHSTLNDLEYFKYKCETCGNISISIDWIDDEDTINNKTT